MVQNLSVNVAHHHVKELLKVNDMIYPFSLPGGGRRGMMKMEYLPHDDDKLI